MVNVKNEKAQLREVPTASKSRHDHASAAGNFRWKLTTRRHFLNNQWTFKRPKSPGSDLYAWGVCFRSDMSRHCGIFLGMF
jgi:hypothetical protein